MQLNKLSAVTGLLLTAMLSACGGGGDEAPPAPAAPAPVALAVSNITLSSTTPTAIAETLLQFDGGVCSGGSGTLTTSWDFGDATAPSALKTHTYAEAKSGANTVTVTCTDTGGATKAKTLDLAIASVAMNGFLGKTWSAYSRIDPTNLSTYPIAGISDSNSGDISGVWIRRDAAGKMEVASGTSNFTSTSWTMSGGLATGIDYSAFNDAVSGGSTAAIDQAVSPNGHVIAAWKAGTSIYVMKKTTLNGAWSPVSQFVFSGDPVTNEAIKVVINDTGDGAIAFCSDGSTSHYPVGAYVVPYISNTIKTSDTKFISKKCVTEDKLLSSTLQSSRAFDIAIDSASTIFAAGVLDATLDPTKSAVALQKYTVGTWSVDQVFANELATSPESLSLSFSPNGNYRAIAWNQVHVNPAPLLDKSNVHASLYAAGAWGAPTAVQSDFITKDYTRPMIAVNDSGVVFLAMRLKDTYSNAKTEVSNYDAAASTPAWSSPFRASEYGFQGADVAIDKYGTGLLTSVDSYNTQAGTFAKKSGVKQWSGFKTISPRYPYSGSGSTFHYQTMRALPDGRAILVTSVYDDQTAVTSTTSPVASGYVLLK